MHTVALSALLVGCATRSPVATDGPDPNPPAGLDRMADAVPRIEPLRVGGPNKPYEVFGQRYVPVTADEPLVQSGLASWYGRKFHGRPTSSGEVYDMHAMTAAHKTMPIPSYARVRNPANGREVIVRVNDRGPFAESRIIDLSYAAALRLDLLRGVAPVQVERLTFAEIRAGVDSQVVAAATFAGIAGAPIELVEPVRVAVPTASTSAAPRPGSAVPVPVAMTRPVSEPAAPTAPAVAVAVAVATALPVTAAPSAVAVPLPADDASANSTPNPAAADGPVLAGWWLQLGAFRNREGALQVQQRLRGDGLGRRSVAVFEADALHRVQVGPYATRALAVDAAPALRQLAGAEPLLIERGPGPFQRSGELR
ncbi:MAG: septal ring lytic transglycosylase RlpA family protein [Rubrivivax sp.]